MVKTHSMCHTFDTTWIPKTGGTRRQRGTALRAVAHPPKAQILVKLPGHSAASCATKLAARPITTRLVGRYCTPPRTYTQEKNLTSRRWRRSVRCWCGAAWRALTPKRRKHTAALDASSRLFASSFGATLRLSDTCRASWTIPRNGSRIHFGKTKRIWPIGGDSGRIGGSRSGPAGN